MKRLIGLSVLVGLLLSPSAMAQDLENWSEVTTNEVGDRFLVFADSIQRDTNIVQYWEYRFFPEPNNAFLDVEVEEPVHGVMLYQSVNCASGITQTKRIIAFDENREELRRIDYEGNGFTAQPMAGSSAAAVVRFVCDSP